MKSLILALALCFALSPLEGATFHSSNMHLVKGRKSKNKGNAKAKGRKPPKHRGQSHSRVN